MRRFFALLNTYVLLNICTTALIGFLFLAPLPAQAESLVVTLSTNNVAIAANYNGASLAVFGVISNDGQTIGRSGAYDIAVIVKGPAHSFVVRHKEPFGPVWINRRQNKFFSFPTYLGVFSSKPLEGLTSAEMLTSLKIGLKPFVYGLQKVPEPEFNEFRDALIRLKKQAGLYREAVDEQMFLTPMVFKTTVPLPAVAPPGDYEADVLVFSDNTLLARHKAPFTLAKIGFEQKVAQVAREHSFAYGLTTALFAVLVGVFANAIFRRE